MCVREREKESERKASLLVDVHFSARIRNIDLQKHHSVPPDCGRKNRMRKRERWRGVEERRRGKVLE